MMGLTPKQRELYDFIARYLRERATAPSFAEMQKAMNSASQSRIHTLLNALQERGYIRRIPRKARAIELVPQDQPARPSYLVALNPEILILTDRYAKQCGIGRDTAVNELLRSCLTEAA